MLSALISESAALAWLAIAFVAALIEVSVPHFGSAFVSAGAVAAAIAAFLGYDAAAQFGVFVLVLVVSLWALRSRLAGRLGGPGVPSRTATLVGHDGVVTQDIDRTLGTGRVTVGGEDWAARSAEPIPSGARIRVTGADGIVLEVNRV